MTQSNFGNAFLKAVDQSPDSPVLFRLNADTTFIISYPYPAKQSPLGGRKRYNVLIDPWLQGSQSDVASWFSTQTHAIESAVQTISDLNAILRMVEQGISDNTELEHSCEESNHVDIAAISHEFTDHCHEATLKELDPATPIFAADKAAELITGWSYFKNVYRLSAFQESFDWRSSSKPPLPAWLGVSRLITPNNSLYYHAALVFCTAGRDEETANAIIYTPHGVEASTFSLIGNAKPPVEVLAFLHGLHDVSLKWSKQLNLGAHNAVEAQNILKAKPKFWIPIHDEVKRGGGLISPLIRRKAFTVKDVLKDQTKSEQLNFVDMANGESIALG